MKAAGGIDALFDMLREWDERLVRETNQSAAPFRVQSYQLLVQMLGQCIGHSATDLGDIRSRMLFLVEEQGIDEGFLVNSVASFVRRTLSENVERQGDSIVLFENVLSRISAGEAEGDSKAEAKARERLAMLKDYRYHLQAQSELTSWETIETVTLESSLKKIWAVLGRSDSARAAGPGADAISAEVLSVFSDIPMGKVLKTVSLEDMATLSLEEAESIRDDIG